MKQGWECPKCGRVYSPKVTECFECNKAPVASKPLYPYWPWYPWPNWNYQPIWKIDTTPNRAWSAVSDSLTLTTVGLEQGE